MRVPCVDNEQRHAALRQVRLMIVDLSNQQLLTDGLANRILDLSGMVLSMMQFDDIAGDMRFSALKSQGRLWAVAY
jgi:hypothetical protein